MQGWSHQIQQHSSGTKATPTGGAKYWRGGGGGGGFKHSSTALGLKPRPWEELNTAGGGDIKHPHSSTHNLL